MIKVMSNQKSPNWPAKKVGKKSGTGRDNNPAKPGKTPPPPKKK